MTERLDDATEDDLEVLHAVRPPIVGVNAATGVPYPVPADWLARIANGEEVTGVSAYQLWHEYDADDRRTGRLLAFVEEEDAAVIRDDAEVDRLGVGARARAIRARLRPELALGRTR